MENCMQGRYLICMKSGHVSVDKNKNEIVKVDQPNMVW